VRVGGILVDMFIWVVDLMKFVNEETATTFTDTDTLAYIYSYSLSITGILRP
jgi:hypothetical protein